MIILLGVMGRTNAQSPHGEALRIDCASCHTADSWTVQRDSITFDHDGTRFALEGQHDRQDCKACHQSLEFSTAPNTCAACHLDVHQQTVGDDCARCHDPSSWLVNQIADIHRQVGFPLLGNHADASCASCHQSETQLYFFPIGNDCYTCHQSDYTATVNPDHAAAGFATDCASCHRIDAPEWTAEAYDHSFFPLTGGHDIAECARCHTGPDYSKTPTDCVACHEADFKGTSNPPHVSLGLSTDCASCHTTAPGWMPAEFNEHDLMYFPIYSGSHEGEWNTCADCHGNPDNYAEFTCIACHLNPETDEDHANVNGYSYSNSACLACHPTGNADDVFDHGQTAFPLTGVHLTTECIQCHANGYTGTPTTCSACHQPDFDQSLNPNHTSLGLSNDCAVCHTTDPDWNPAAFPAHNDYYALNGAHALIANECATCHNGDYNNTPTTCFGCHQTDFEQTTDPNHVQAQFSTDCATCHSEAAWTPATFDHDNQYFPIYSGEHAGEWSQCVDCHTTPGDFTQFTCVTCHMATETGEQHGGVAGYSFNSAACLVCHPTGSADDAFDHSETAFPLTGAHQTMDCLSCHASGYTGTPTECSACHLMDHNQAANPNHVALGISTDCASCHTTDPGWSPATFATHNDYYPLNGAHAMIANECVSCHNGDYNNTPNTCAGCHQQDYDQTTDPPHVTLQFSTDCATCHNEGAWAPSTFDHDAQHFPIYTGSHAGVWNQCSECHTTPGNYALFTCTTCHVQGETNDDHAGVPGYIYESTACLACHPTGNGDDGFDHNTTAFPLTGAHIGVNCLECHASGYPGTPTACASCHTGDFNGSINPNHGALGLPTDCILCHSTDPDWNPAQFPVHNDYYALNGAHALIANQCATCHNGDYNNTPNTCVGCHLDDYTATVSPPHAASGFNTECASCHTESAWSPANFDHDAQYFPIYSGEHQGEWSQCTDCHTQPGDFSVFTCTTCHVAGETNEQHAGVGGYVYDSPYCLACHPTGSAENVFDHNGTNFPLTGAHMTVNCMECHAAGFPGTPTDCNACHITDFNESMNPNHGALGLPTDCVMCHTTDPDWNPAQFPIHNEYYALNGAHALIADQCVTCHNGDYNNTPNTCVGCHQADFDQTDNPPHMALQFSNECATCHGESSWAPAGMPTHDDYYALNGAHALIANECATCHNGDYNNTPNTCVGCHLDDYTATVNPPHAASGFNTDCAACHSESGWSPANFDHDAQYFPIYSGEHQGEWSQCTDCHTQPGDFSVFTCTTCHVAGETNAQHTGVGGYVYDSPYCLACHPTGSAENVFDHNGTNFPLTGAHMTVNCMECHASGFPGTPTDCNACHMPDFNQSTNPNHVALSIPTDCASCHTTDPDWNPAQFPIHNQYYALNGAHALIADQCVTCHNGDYNNTPNTCFGCHSTDYNQTTNPSHTALQFPTDCASCHSEDAWTPAAFEDHDAQYFPIYSGGHQGAWDQCNDCHTNPNNYAIYSCVVCHTPTPTNQEHAGVNGYVYENAACLACHPTGSAQGAFDHANSNFPLTGAHVTVDCIECHASGYAGTPTDCDACHLPDYNQASNPNHISLNLPTNCAACHTTDPDWNPALFPDHDDYYPLLGAHAAIANQCATCHNGNYNNTPNTCVGCHLTEYNGTNDPDHQAANFPTDCAACHSQNAWVPANWDHDDMYFPIYSGRHEGEWNQCTQCHSNPNNYAVFTCLTCHTAGETNQEHDEVSGYQYNSPACLACHPNGEAD